MDTALLGKPCSTNAWEDFGHGRIEKRTCRAYDDLGHIEKPSKWGGLNTIFVVDSFVENKSSGKISSEQRLYISSLPSNAAQLSIKTREHWSIENNLHWSYFSWVSISHQKNSVIKGLNSELHIDWSFQKYLTFG